MEKEKLTILYPLDMINIISGNKKVFMFVEFMLEKAVEFNDENSAILGEDFFPVASFNDKAFTYEFEYEFFVKSLVDFVEYIYDIDAESISKLYRYLLLSTETKATRARHIFFVVILGHYYKFSGGFYSDITKNKSMLYWNKLVKNEYGNIANARTIPFRAFVMEELEKQELAERLKEFELETVAIGKAKIKGYMKDSEVGEYPQIYKLDRELSED